jgi:hypothetical protein
LEENRVGLGIHLLALPVSTAGHLWFALLKEKAMHLFLHVHAKNLYRWWISVAEME